MTSLNHDALTRLPGRLLFADRLELACSEARRYRQASALLLVDIDRLDAVNASLGVTAGDQLLIEVAWRMLSSVRETDTVARLDGDGFGIVLGRLAVAPETGAVVRRLVEALAAPYFLDAGAAHISCSMGIALLPRHATDASGLEHCARSALHSAKAAGGDTACVFATLDGEPPADACLL